MYGTADKHPQLVDFIEDEVPVEKSPHLLHVNRKISFVQIAVALVCIAGAFAVLSAPLKSRTGVLTWLQEGPEDEDIPPTSDSPGTDRKPSKYSKFTVNLFDHPKVTAAFAGIKTASREHVMSTCLGPDNNIEVFLNEEASQRDLLFNDGFTVFNLDCRDAEANPNIAFILVLDLKGNIIAVHNPSVRAEAVSMFSPDTVMFSCISKGGAWLWNFKTDELTEIPYTLDAHTLQYVPGEEAFYGLDRGNKFSPSTAVGYNLAGEKIWSFEQPESHINFMTVRGDYAYLSLRSFSCLVKVEKATNRVIWQLGGDNSNFAIYDKDGNLHDHNTWDHQHKFQFLDDHYVSLFDNHVNNEKQFINGDNSRMVILKLSEDEHYAQEVFAFDTGDKSRIYGGADILPSGNVLGNSYPMVVEPDVEDRKYQVNVWEVSPVGEIVGRIGFIGLNPKAPQDTTSNFFHSVAPLEEPPIGWIVYNVERFYAAPTLTQPCVSQDEGKSFVKVLAFNSVRTQGDTPGMFYLVDSTDATVYAHQSFEFHGSWLPRSVSIAIPDDFDSESKDVTLIISNQWGNNRVVRLGSLSSLNNCEGIVNSRAFLL